MIDIWSHESKIYPKIDAEGMRGGNVIIEKFKLGDDIMVDVIIKKYKEVKLSIKNSMPIRGLKVSLNFRKGDRIFLRADNDHDGLHIHPTGQKDYKKSVSEDTRLSQFISDIFEESRKIIQSKFSKQVVNGKGFVGSV